MTLKKRTAITIGWYPIVREVVRFCGYVSPKEGRCFRRAQWFRHHNLPISTSYRCDTHVIPGPAR